MGLDREVKNVQELIVSKKPSGTVFPFEYHFCISAFLCVSSLHRHFDQNGGTYTMLTGWHELGRLKFLKSNNSS